MAVTLKQLASELGVSVATVSLALRNDPLVAEKTRRKVLDLANKRDYVSSYLGKALQSRRTHLIGFLLPGVTHSFYDEILQGAGDAAIKTGYGLLVGWVNDSPQNNLRQVSMMLEKDVDALIISDHKGLVSGCEERFLRRGKPVVYCTGTPRDDFACVVNDDILGGKLALDLLYAHGHRHILISGQHALRCQGNKLAAAGLPVRLTEYFDVSEAINAILQDRSITAIAAYADHEAFDLMYGLRAHNIRVPEDVSIVGFNDDPPASRPEYQLTTIAQQRAELGYASVELAIKMLNFTNQECETKIILPPSAVIRKTVINRTSLSL